MKKAFATNLRHVRAQLGWTTSQIAAKNLGLKRATYQAYEEGRSMPGAEGLCHMAEIMGITNLRGFLSDPNFDYRQQDAVPRIKNESPLVSNYRVASERDKKLVDVILGIPTE